MCFGSTLGFPTKLTKPQRKAPVPLQNSGTGRKQINAFDHRSILSNDVSNHSGARKQNNFQLYLNRIKPLLLPRRAAAGPLDRRPFQYSILCIRLTFSLIHASLCHHFSRLNPLTLDNLSHLSPSSDPPQPAGAPWTLL